MSNVVRAMLVLLPLIGSAGGFAHAQPKDKAAFNVKAVIKKIEVDKGLLVFSSGQMERSVKTAADFKVLDVSGKELAAGLGSKELKEGAEVTITIEPKDGKAFVKLIRLGQAVAKPPPQKPDSKEPDKKVDTSKLVPLTDLGLEKYQGFQGGLYPDGKNERPAAHEAAGLALAKSVQPRDADGKPSKDGKIVLLGIGFSNTVQGFNGFMQVAQDDKDINPNVVLVNGADGGMSANMVQNPDDNGRGAKYWAAVDDKLKAAGVTRGPGTGHLDQGDQSRTRMRASFRNTFAICKSELTKIVQVLPERFPNAKLVYLSSRTYGGWAEAPPGRVGGPGNSEPYSYETGFAVKWLIEQQLKGDAELNYDRQTGASKAPWLSWGPYLWANGEIKRKDGFSFQTSDFTDRDQMHHSPHGMTKMGRQLLQFFKTDATTRQWFLR